MSEKIQLPQVCIRSLNDKVFEKKKAACRQIEMMTKEMNSAGFNQNLKDLIAYLVQEFIGTTSGSSKTGGLLALSSMAIALDRNAKLYLEDILRPIINCTYDPNREVRYRALEAMYNVAKSVRGDCLKYLEELFDLIIRMCEDSDLSIREASNLVDRLIKDIILEHPVIDTLVLIDIIRERIYALTENTRKMILSWINFLDSVPQIDLLPHVQDVLDGLLKISCDSNKDIRRAAEVILQEFANKIEHGHDKVDFKHLIKILLIHVQTDSCLVQNISLQWIAQSIKLANSADILANSANILAAILPCLSYSRIDNNDMIESMDETPKLLQRKNIELAKEINESLMKLVTKPNQGVTNPTVATAETTVTADRDTKQECEKIPEENSMIANIILVLVNELELGPKTSTQTKIAILQWICQIYENVQIDIDEKVEEKLIAILLNTLPDQSDSVVQMDLKVLGKIIFKYQGESLNREESKKYQKFIKSLVDLFFRNPDIFKERGSFIVCQLCTIMDGRIVFLTLSDILRDYKNNKFVQEMIHSFNTILLTAKELSTLRKNLTNMYKLSENGDTSALKLFVKLYNTWCYSPVSAISLCFLTKSYQQSAKMILHFGEIGVHSVDILVEIDQLVQLIESPVFASLRLDLLDARHTVCLRRALNGLLMLLPQSDAFHLLRKRLQCVPIGTEVSEHHQASNVKQTAKSKTNTKADHAYTVDFDELFEHYVHVQQSNST